MKDKEKQIEEMNEDLTRAVEYDIENSDLIDSYATAIKLIKLGWIKPTEDSVVLSKEELTKEPYNEFCKGCPNARIRSSGITVCCADYNCLQFSRYANLLDKYKQASKETAQKILKEASKCSDNFYIKVKEILSDLDLIKE